MKIGVKYCGGCNPRYDRTGLVDLLKWDFPDVTTDLTQPVDHVVVVCGCPSACAKVDHVAAGQTVLTSPEHYPALRDRLKKDESQK